MIVEAAATEAAVVMTVGAADMEVVVVSRFKFVNQPTSSLASHVRRKNNLSCACS